MGSPMKRLVEDRVKDLRQRLDGGLLCGEPIKTEDELLVAAYELGRAEGSRFTAHIYDPDPIQKPAGVN